MIAPDLMAAVAAREMAAMAAAAAAVEEEETQEEQEEEREDDEEKDARMCVRNFSVASRRGGPFVKTYDCGTAEGGRGDGARGRRN